MKEHRGGNRPRSALLAQLALQTAAFAASEMERLARRRAAAKAYERSQTRARLETGRFLVSA
jgi:hypothetical protein